jgi:hypothetical protein
VVGLLRAEGMRIGMEKKKRTAERREERGKGILKGRRAEETEG